MSHVSVGSPASATRRLRPVALAAAVVLGALGLAAPAAHAASGNLPGGTSISVGITAPANGANVPAPPGSVGVTGTASVGQGQPVADTTLVYVVDVSGSTGSGSSGCGGNQNPTKDGLSNTILDCEIAAGRALNQQAIAAGTVDQTGVVFFDTTATIGDVGPAQPGTQGLTAPSTDANGSGLPDVEETLRTAAVAQNTNFEAAVQRACQLVQQSLNTNNIVVFLSDGQATVGGSALDDLPCTPTGATFQTFAVGNGASCTANLAGRGSLAQIAAATGGTCTPVTNVATLPNIIPGVIASQLTRLELTVDGGPPSNITSTASPSLPRNGPASVTYSSTVNGLTPGSHTICVRAFGSDGGGGGSVVECRTVVVYAVPKVSIGDVTVSEGNAGTTTPATFKVTLDQPSPAAVTVTYGTANGTATAGSDYTGATGSVAFAPGQTSRDVVVSVLGDNADEPDETFNLAAMAVTGATVLDGTGVGTIVDDERNGAFTCRASALRLTGLLEPTVANRPDAPCKDGYGTIVQLKLSVTGLLTTVNTPNAKTDQTPDDLTVAPAIGDGATAHADSADALVSLGIGATSTVSDAKASCTSAGVPTLSASSKVAGLKVNGQSYGVVAQPVTIPLLLATLRINATVSSAGKITQRAIWLDNALLPDVIIGEASAGYSGNPCDA